LTAAAFAAFQATKGIIVDGQGPQTVRRLKIDLKGEETSGAA
jgi:N-acetylmuramoyl-L-alanine amidase